MHFIDNKSLLLNLMQKGALVITPTNRLRQELLNNFLQAYPQLVQNKPQCLTYGAFLGRCLTKLSQHEAQYPHPFVLSSAQLRQLWRQILGWQLEREVNEGLLKSIEQAWSICHSWQVDLHDEAFSPIEQARQFQQAAVKLQQELRGMNALAADELANYLCAQKQYYAENTLVWVCFNEFIPQQCHLQKYLQEKGCQLYYYDLSAQKNSLWQFEAKDENEESQQLIHWVTQRLESGDRRIGVIVANLLEKAPQMQRLFQQHLPSSAFTLASKKALAAHPLIAHALYLLNLDGTMLSNQQLRLLLHSPYLGHSEEEMLARAQFMEESDTLQDSSIKQTLLIKLLSPIAPQLSKLLETVVAFPQKTSVEEWLSLFSSRLMNLGFPGPCLREPVAHQYYERFLLLFAEFKQLALVSPTMSRQQALKAFNELAQTTILQAGNPTAPIQILDVVEAGGCTFDSLWMMGLTDECLPAKVKRSAFIPFALQQKNSLPHIDPTQELQLAKKIITRLQNSSQFSVFSYPRFSEDKPNMPSPLISSLNRLSMAFALEPAPSLLECYHENYQLPLKEGERIQGGTALLARQAKCPFQAFAAHRLHAKPMLLATEGPNAQERGQVIHKVMELLWQDLQSQQAFLALNEAQLIQYIDQAIHKALDPLIRQRRNTFPKLIQEVEFSRLKRLIYDFLNCERQRSSFTIEALEQSFTLQLAGIEFRLRVDRIDRVDENKWVIDYKSSFPEAAPWHEERPQEPQLLVYALLDEEINTILFAQLKAGRVAYKGLSQNDNTPSGITSLKGKEDWLTHRQQWFGKLQKLAEEFNLGLCAPNPTKPTLCQQCDYPNLCRLPR